jgi:hypothetical protein
MDQKSSKTKASRVAMALVLVPALAVAVLWLGMGQLSLSAVEIQDEAVSASAQVPATLVEVGGVVPALKSWEYTREALDPLGSDLNTRVQRTPPAP